MLFTITFGTLSFLIDSKTERRDRSWKLSQCNIAKQYWLKAVWKYYKNRKIGLRPTGNLSGIMPKLWTWLWSKPSSVCHTECSPQCTTRWLCWSALHEFVFWFRVGKHYPCVHGPWMGCSLLRFSRIYKWKPPSSTLDLQPHSDTRCTSNRHSIQPTAFRDRVIDRSICGRFKPKCHAHPGAIPANRLRIRWVCTVHCIYSRRHPHRLSV